jgi:hypothetical protein
VRALSGRPHLRTGSKADTSVNVRAVPPCREVVLLLVVLLLAAKNSGLPAGSRPRTARPKGLALTPLGQAGAQWPQEENNTRGFIGCLGLERFHVLVSLGLSDYSFFQLRALGQNSRLEESPYVDQQAACHCHDSHPTDALALSVAKSLLPGIRALGIEELQESGSAEKSGTPLRKQVWCSIRH